METIPSSYQKNLTEVIQHIARYFFICKNQTITFTPGIFNIQRYKFYTKYTDIISIFKKSNCKYFKEKTGQGDSEGSQLFIVLNMEVVFVKSNTKTFKALNYEFGFVRNLWKI